MANFLDSLGMSGSIDIHISVSQACGLEMMILDPHGNVKSYAQLPLDYNEALREVSDYGELKNGIETLFKSRNINPKKANVYISMQTVWFGLKEGLPLLLDDSAITNIVVGELELTYIFKRKDPIPCWFDALASTNSDSRSVFYTAIQADVVDKIKEIISDLGANLMSIECSLFADIKGLYLTGVAANQMNNNDSWSLMIVNNSGFQLLGLQGKKILEYYEEPLPIKSYEGEEIYAAIENAAQIALMSSPSSSLVIVSETDLVSAEILGKRLQFGGSIITVEDNQFRKEPLMEMSLNILPEDQIKVSLHAIGATASSEILDNNVNFLEAAGQKAAKNDVLEIPIGNGKVIQLTALKATIIAAALLVIVLGPLGGICLITSKMYASAQEQSSALDTQITELDEQLKKYENKNGKEQFDPMAEIEKVLKNNRSKIMAYAALGESIPKNLYLTYFMTGDDGAIDIKGCADSVEDVYVFFRNLKDSLVESKLRLNKLDLKNGSLDSVVNNTASTIDTAPYVFEITNMSDAQLNSFMNKLVGGKNASSSSSSSNSSSSSSSSSDSTTNTSTSSSDSSSNANSADSSATPDASNSAPAGK